MSSVDPSSPSDSASASSLTIEDTDTVLVDSISPSQPFDQSMPIIHTTSNSVQQLKNEPTTQASVTESMPTPLPAVGTNPSPSFTSPSPSTSADVLVSPPTSSPSPSVPSTSVGSSSKVSTARMAAVRSQITDACHITEPENGNDGNVFVHVIDGTGEFSCTPNDLTYLVLHASTRPSSYSVVGIMGCQSGGKSTLLNLLFGTKFQEMDSSLGRSQTTKGVWMDSGCKKRDLVIMDLEGTDSGERGEDRTTFERQTSLYALAVAEVLLINMWEHDIGRYTASNYGILKTVFEVNLQLFDSQNKTILMFVIRDHVEDDTPFSQIVTKLGREVEKIWSEIRKPEKFSQTTVQQLFELKFVALPHMKLQKQQFIEKVDQLRLKFIDPNHSEYLFASDSHGKKSVPADGFGVYMEQCWTAIQKNKELNLPTQKEMLATFRCDEIIHQLTVEQLVPGLHDLKESASNDLIADRFAREVNPLIQNILSDYSAATQHYHADIVNVKRLEFLRKMTKELEDIYSSQARKFVQQEMIDRLKKELKTQLSVAPMKEKGVASSTGGSDAPHPHFIEIARKSAQSALEYAGPELAKFGLDIFTSPDQVGLSSETVRSLIASWASLSKKIEDELSTAIDAAISVERASQLKKLSFHLDKVFKTHLSVPLNSLLKKANPSTMWTEVGQLYRTTYSKVIKEYVLDTLLPSYEASSDEQIALEQQSEKQLSQLFRLIIDQHAAMIGVYMRSKFDKLFRSDSTGRIRTWTQNENIRKLFRHARDEALKQLDLFCIFRLDEFKDANSVANKLAAEMDEAPVLSRRGSMKRMNSSLTNSTSIEHVTEDEKEPLEEEEEKIGQTSIDYSLYDAANIILDPTQRLEKESTFRFEIEGALREAEIAQAQNASNTKVPMWMIGLVCFLGMDEILAVLRNPFLLFLIVVVGGGAYMAHQVGALMPMVAVAKTTATHLLGQIQAGFTPVPNQGLPSSSPTSPSLSGDGIARRGSLTQTSGSGLTVGTIRSHERNLSLSKSYTDQPPSPTHRRNPGSISSSDLLPSTMRTQSTVELQDLTPRPDLTQDEDEDQQSLESTTKKRTPHTVE